MDPFTILAQSRLLPVATVDNPEDGPFLAEALMRAGLTILEITLRTSAAAEALAAVKKTFPEMCLGAGTILFDEQVSGAFDAGLHFGVAPGLNEGLLENALHRGLPMMPGVVTPSEIDRAWRLGAKTLKFFPAEPAGGANYLKAVAAPFSHTGVRFVPTGGIRVASLPGYYALKPVLAVGGSWFVAADLIRERRTAEVERLTREALEIAAQ